MTIAYASHVSGSLMSAGWGSVIYTAAGTPTTGDTSIAVAVGSNIPTRSIGGGYAAYTTPGGNVNFAYETAQFAGPVGDQKARVGLTIDAYTNGDALFFGYPMSPTDDMSGIEKAVMYAFKVTGLKTGATPFNAYVFSEASTVNGTEKEVQIVTTVDNCAIIGIAFSVNPISAASGDPATILNVTNFDSYYTTYAKASFLADAGAAGTKNVRFETGNGGTNILAIALEPETDPGGGGGNGPMYYYQKNPISFGFGG